MRSRIGVRKESNSQLLRRSVPPPSMQRSTPAPPVNLTGADWRSHLADQRDRVFEPFTREAPS
jgi:hypothetical protein